MTELRRKPRSESLSVEYDHYQYDDDGVPVFWENREGKVMHKRVGYFAQYCPECGEIMHDDDHSRASCVEKCGGFHDNVELSFEERKKVHAYGDK